VAPQIKNAAPWLAMVGILVVTAIELHHQGRLWRSASGRLLCWIRDSLLLNVLMLVFPLAGVKAWQMGT
jgi:hypothetical protein